jgi:hypothetical protein
VIALGLISELAPLAGDLPASFRERALKFGSGKRRESFLAGRVLLQMMLREKGLAQSLPHIAYAEHGKPYFDSFDGAFFNISHSASIIAVCLCGSETGVDLEQVKPRHNLEGLEKRELVEDETVFVKQDPSLEVERFTALWTLRECLVKVTGEGLAGVGGVKPAPSRGMTLAAGCPSGIATCRLYPSLQGSRWPMWLTSFSRKGEDAEPVWADRDGFSTMAPPERGMKFRVNP